jgi:ferrous iron transport protein B
VVGTPNVGKTSLINALAGSRLRVGNWPGTTLEVERAEAFLPCGRVTLIDLPGAYTLAGTASDEEALLPALASDPDALIVNIVDAGNLARDLTLTLELGELGRPMVVAVNLLGPARAGGQGVDTSALERRLGVPVVAVSAHVGSGVAALVAAASRATAATLQVSYPTALASAADRLQPLAGTRWHALAALSGEHPAWRAPAIAGVAARGTAAADEAARAAPPRTAGAEPASRDALLATARVERDALEERGVDTFLTLIDARHQAAHAMASAATRDPAHPRRAGDAIDRVVLHPVIGPIALVLGLGLTFHLTFALSNPWVAFLGTVQDVLAGWTAALPLPPLASAFLAGAVIEGVGTVVAFVPVLFALYAILGFLENAGILARVAFLADGLMRAVGLPGRAVLPMVLSLGCTVPAVQATRMLDQRGDRVRVALALPSIPCGARLPVFVLLAAAFVPAFAAVVVTGLYLLGFAVAVISALLFRHLLRGDQGTGAMELPGYRMPPPSLVLRLAWARTRAFLASAGGPIFVAVVVVWALLTFELPGGGSVFEAVARGLVPLFAPLGLDDWRVVGALVPGAIAKEVVIGSLALTFIGGEATAALGLGAGLLQIAAGFADAVRETLTGLWGLALVTEPPDGALGARLAGALPAGGALALMVFVLLYVPCVATLSAIRAAFGARYALLSAAYQLTVAYLAAFLVFRLWP